MTGSELVSKNIEVPLLIDADSAAIQAYGILNEKQGEGPHPTVVLVGRG